MRFVYRTITAVKRHGFKQFHEQCRIMPKALVILSEGAEEMETVIAVDVLRRGGIDVTLAGLMNSDPVLCSRNVKIVPDAALSDAVKQGPYDVVVCPGGANGAKNLAASKEVGEILQDQEKGGRVIAAVCAAPIALASHKVGSGKNVTSHPSVKDKLGKYITSKTTVTLCFVVVFQFTSTRDRSTGGKLKSRGPGPASSLEIVEAIQGKEKADSLVAPMLVKM
ncbi:Parkinson disease protein 7 homolog [Ruditapes philippinarum]|uniref:Parkinson disease protein 7 homolog n=1 Tax=Ruditapes philippinarum TaxID=129788 RepID=UPI00295B6A0D|nr:Parkinson disease protein 7 homolog [Ruditapes philippinarum]